jgi:hypothetical protein
MVEGWDYSDSFKPILDDDSSSSSDEEEDIVPIPRGMESGVVKYKKIIHEEELLPE